MKIKKASGEEDHYDPNKILDSLLRAGASIELAQDLLTELQDELYEGISTRKLYRIVFSKLRKRSNKTAGKYNLKKGITDLGPSGFPFEQFISAILTKQGYQTQTGQFIEGHCVTHEVDVVAQKGVEKHMIECKFHTEPGRKCDVKTPLYIQSRFVDVATRWKNEHPQYTTLKGWIFTNTRFTSEAIQYGKCMGLGLVSWDYPAHGNLRDLAGTLNIYPITCITALTGKDTRFLIDQGLVTCNQLIERKGLLDQLRIAGGRKKKILTEAEDLVG